MGCCSSRARLCIECLWGGDVLAALTRREVGRGATAEVFSCHDARRGHFVLKVPTDPDAPQVTRELAALRALRTTRCPHVVGLVGTGWCQKPRGITLTKHAGDIFDSAADFQVSAWNARRYTRQILSALAHCHDLGIVHRDVKPENILFADEDERDNVSGVGTGGGVVLCDFGHCWQQGTRTGRMKSRAGTICYSAPEVLSARADRPYTARCDIWSLGIVVWVLLTGRPPWESQTDGGMKAEIRRTPHLGIRPTDTETAIFEEQDGAVEFLDAALSTDPSQRPSARVLRTYSFSTQATI